MFSNSFCCQILEFLQSVLVATYFKISFIFIRNPRDVFSGHTPAIKRVIESERFFYILLVALTLNSISVPAITATPANPILYNCCKGNRLGTSFYFVGHLAGSPLHVVSVEYLEIVLKKRKFEKVRRDFVMVVKDPGAN